MFSIGNRVIILHRGSCYGKHGVVTQVKPGKQYAYGVRADGDNYDFYYGANELQSEQDVCQDALVPASVNQDA